MEVTKVDLNIYLLGKVMNNIHIHMYTYLCGTGSDRLLKTLGLLGTRDRLFKASLA